MFFWGLGENLNLIKINKDAKHKKPQQLHRNLNNVEEQTVTTLNWHFEAAFCVSLGSLCVMLKLVWITETFVCDTHAKNTQIRKGANTISQQWSISRSNCRHHKPCVLYTFISTSLFYFSLYWHIVLKGHDMCSWAHVFQPLHTCHLP